MIALEHIHPMIVHFPIVFFLTLATFDIVAVVRRVDVTGRTSTGNVSVGLAVLAALAAAVAAGFGDVALDIARSHGLKSSIAETHERLGGLTAVIFVIWAVARGVLWWRDIRLAGGSSMAVPIIEVVGTGLVMLTAYYGGVLVFDFGVNVTRAAGGR